MSVTHGADVEGLRESARKLADTAHALLNVNVTITRRAWDVRWNGPDANRFREAWDAEYSPQLSQVSGALNQAAAEVLEQAADQERASSADGTTSSATKDLQTRLNVQRDLLTFLVNAYQVGTAMAAHPEAWKSFETFNRAWDLGEAFSSTFAKAGNGVLGVLGTAVSAHEVVKGVKAGDATAVVQNGVPLGVTALVSRGIVASGTGAAVSVAWTGGTMIGNQLNEAMEGTSYGDKVRDNFDFVFDQFGAAGMLLTPAVLIQSGLEMIGDDDDAPPIP